MSSSNKDCEEYARDCVRLAEKPTTPPEIRDQLLIMARNWMQLAMSEEGKTDARSASAAGSAYGN
jgi:hypothetical protein